MPVSKGVWGIDIGQCALKALRLEMIDGKPTATAFDYVEHPKILSQPDADPDQLIREALEQFLSRNQVKHDQVAIGIAGQSGLARFVKLPPVEEKKIGDIVKFEAKQQIPFPLDEVVWDYQKIAGGSVSDGFAMETEIGLFAMKRDVIARYLGYFTGSKIEVHVVQMSPLALVNFATYDVLKRGGANPPPSEEVAADDAPRGKKRCVVVLDIGTDASNLIITDGEKIIWQRPIPLGGNNFTRALTKELKLTFAKAEHLKRNAAKSPELPQILKALKPVLQDFVGEVQRSLGYFTNTHRDAHVAYMVGLGSAFRLPGLQKYLAEKLQLEVKKPSNYSRLAGDEIIKSPVFQENLLSFPVAYGLALQGLGEARLTTNLLPTEIRTDRLIRAKKPFAVAAAAALLLGTGALALGYGKSYDAINDKGIVDAMGSAEKAGKAYTAQEGKYSTAIGSVKDQQTQVKAIIAGQDERLNWPRFEEVFSAALPKPGIGGNVQAEELWRTTEATKAIEWFERRLRVGVPIDLAVEDARSEHPKHLAMVNVESVYCRWVDNLGDFYKNADDAVYGDPAQQRGFGESIADWMKDDEKEKDEAKGRMKPKAPTGGGWVFEVRGYTEYDAGQNAGRQFIGKALIRNLQRTDDFAGVKDGKGQEKIRKYVPGVEDPVKNRISHAFIYHVWTDSAAHINQTYLDPLVSTAAASSMGGTGAPPGTGGGSSLGPPGGTASAGTGGMGNTDGSSTGGAAQAGPPWAPLTGASTGSGGAGGAMGGPGGMMPPGASGGSSLGPPGGMGGGMGVPPVGGTGGAPATAPSASNRRRYEFVVMFTWREPAQRAAAPSEGSTTTSSSGSSGTSTGSSDN